MTSVGKPATAPAAPVATLLVPGPGAPLPVPGLKRMRVNGVDLGYVEQGHGTPVLFVHGASSDHRLWHAQREVFSRDYRFVALDQRYHGSGRWSDDGQHYSAQTQVEDLARFIRGLDCGPAYVVGWSLSGLTALSLAASHPTLLRGVFAYEPSPPVATISDDAENTRLQQDLMEMIGPALAAVRSGDHATAIRLFMDGVNAQPGTFDALPISGQQMLLENARTLALQFSGASLQPIDAALLAAIPVPVTIVRGEMTRPCYQITADAACRHIAHARSRVVAGARHLWPVLSPSAFSQIVLEFLQNDEVTA